jgi:hypothetical protein
MRNKKNKCDDCGGAIKYDAPFSAKDADGNTIIVCSDCYADGDYHKRFVKELKERETEWNKNHDYLLKILR